VKRAAARQARASAIPGGGNGAHPSTASGANGNAGPSAQAFWRHAEALAPQQPWKIVARTLGVNEQLAVDCHRHRTLPPGIDDDALERFIGRPLP
jgi:hypothetical protein